MPQAPGASSSDLRWGFRCCLVHALAVTILGTISLVGGSSTTGKVTIVIVLVVIWALSLQGVRVATDRGYGLGGCRLNVARAALGVTSPVLIAHGAMRSVALDPGVEGPGFGAVVCLSSAARGGGDADGSVLTEATGARCPSDDVIVEVQWLVDGAGEGVSCLLPVLDAEDLPVGLPEATLDHELGAAESSRLRSRETSALRVSAFAQHDDLANA